MLEVANVEHALFGMFSRSYSLRRFPATDPSFGYCLNTVLPHLSFRLRIALRATVLRFPSSV